MRNTYLVLFLMICAFDTSAQVSLSSFSYAVSKEYPFGRLNPAAPSETADYEPFIGLSDCKLQTRDAQQQWLKDSVDVIWKFKYIMNGLGVQDETFRSDGKYASSIRQYDTAAGNWYVTNFSSARPSKSPSTWEGGMNGNEMVLYSELKAPNGTEGFYKITFHDISEKGFEWKGEWVNTDETISYPTLYLSCKKRKP